MPLIIVFDSDVMRGVDHVDRGVMLAIATQKKGAKIGDKSLRILVVLVVRG